MFAAQTSSRITDAYRMTKIHIAAWPYLLGEFRIKKKLFLNVNVRGLVPRIPDAQSSERCITP